MNKKKYSYLEHLILTAKKYEIEEYLFYEEKGRKLTAKQLELILLRNGISVPKDETPAPMPDMGGGMGGMGGMM